MVEQHLESAEIPSKKIPVVVSGLPGKMATLVAEAVSQSADFELLHLGLSSEKHTLYPALFNTGSRPEPYVLMWGPLQHGTVLSQAKEVFASDVIAIDYTTPDSLNVNVQQYIDAGVPFVMGTTGGDREALVEAVHNSEVSAVIDTNMAPHIVIAKAMIQSAAENFGGSLRGWGLTIKESHQAAKKDVSGTAKAWQPLLEQLGVESRGIDSIRDKNTQTSLGIRNLDGHAYHWFTLETSDRSAVLEISTKVEGRAPYVEGTLMAVKFLYKKVTEGSRGEVFTMVDVLKARGV